MAPFVSPKTWFNKRGGSGSGNGSGSKKKKTTLSTTTSSSLTMTSFPLNSTNYHNKDPIYYTAPSTTTPTTVDIALALSKQRAYSSSPISPPGTTTSGTTTLVNSNITTTNYPSGRYMVKDAALLSPTSSTGGNGIASVSLPHLPYNPMSSPEQTYIPRTTYKPKPSRSATASDDTPAAEVSNPWHKAQKLQELQNCIQSNHHQYQPPSKSSSSQPLPFPADAQPLQFANLSTTGETTKGSARARWFLNRARTNRNKSTQNLTQTQDHPMQEQQQQQKQPEHQLERQSSRGTFKGMAARFRSSSENVRALETVAQEYARTIKALWQMVAEEELSQRLADATPEEREWIILHHSNLSETSTLASCYFIPNQLLNANANASRNPYNRFSRESNGSEDSHTSAGNGSCNSRCNSRLSYVEPAYNYNKNHYTHHSQSDHFQAPPLSPIRESCHVHGSPSSSKPDSFETVPHHPQPTTMGVRSTFQESRRVHPDLQSSPTSKGRDTDRFNENDDSNVIQRRGTKVSEMVKQSAMELQKHDHYTLQQRIDMEEDWRLQAKLLQGNVEAAVRIQHSREHHNSLYAVHHHTTFPEYEPPEDDYDDKEELSENDPRLMSGIISAAAALASAQEVDPEKIGKYEEAAIRARSRRDYEDIERELKLLGLLRYEIGTESQLGSAFSEGEETSSEGVVDPEDPETMLGVAHKVGVFGVRRESRLMYHARDGSRQTVEVI